jgi:glucoamylase
VQDRTALDGLIEIRNRGGGGVMPISELIGTDFLQLVRFGIRAPDDPWIQASVSVADALLKADTPCGPAWRRYTRDGYGEHEDGAPFDGTGIGRPWPLLTGERGHYELAAGRDPTPCLEAMSAMAGPGGMLPEQVWDAAPIAERRLYPGKPTGSAMPLAWAHAEFIKLAISRAIRRPVDRLESVWRRWGGRRPLAAAAVWTPNANVTRIRRGSALLVAVFKPARLHWGRDGWLAVADLETTDTGLGVHIVRLPAAALAGCGQIDFTFQWCGDGQWEGRDYHLDVTD